MGKEKIQRLPAPLKEIEGIVRVESLTNEAYNKDTTRDERIDVKNRRYRQGEIAASEYFIHVR